MESSHIGLIFALIGLVSVFFTPFMRHSVVRYPSMWYFRSMVIIAVLVFHPGTRTTALLAVAAGLALYLLWSHMVRQWAMSFKLTAESSGIDENCEPHTIGLAEAFVGPIDYHVDGYPLMVHHAMG